MKTKIQLADIVKLKKLFVEIIEKEVEIGETLERITNNEGERQAIFYSIENDLSTTISNLEKIGFEIETSNKHIELYI